jgi:hypothetical protein
MAKETKQRVPSRAVLGFETNKTKKYCVPHIATAAQK